MKKEKQVPYHFNTDYRLRKDCKSQSGQTIQSGAIGHFRGIDEDGVCVTLIGTDKIYTLPIQDIIVPKKRFNEFWEKAYEETIS